LVQPADVGWFSVIKKAYKRVWNNWYMTTDRNFTARGNMKSSGYVMCLDWISKIWSELDPELVKKSFEICGIHDHSMVDGKVRIRYDNLHKMLKIFIVEGNHS